MSNSFINRKEAGKSFEQEISELLGARSATSAEQQLGYDLVLPDGTTIDCKHDIRGGKTKNFFAEVVTGLKSPKPGCLFTTMADYVLLKFGDQDLYLFRPCDFSRFYLTVVTHKDFKTVTCTNPNGYGSIGVLIPKRYLTDFARLVSIEELVVLFKSQEHESKIFRREAA